MQTPPETETAVAGDTPSSSSASDALASAPVVDHGPTLDEHSSTLEAHTATLETQGQTIGEHESRFRELEDELGSVRDRVEGFFADHAARTKPAADGTIPTSTAANEDGVQPGHAGLGTGDGPAGLR